MAIYDTKGKLPSFEEVRQVFGADALVRSSIADEIWMELRTVKQVGTHSLKVTITGKPPEGQFCIASDMEKGYKFADGRFYGVQNVTVCSNYDNCPHAGRASVFKCGCYLYSIRKSPDCLQEDQSFSNCI